MSSSAAEKYGGFSGAGRLHFRRRLYFIDKRFQLAFAGNILLVAGVCMFTTALVVSWFFVYFMTDNLSASIDRSYIIKLGIILFFVAAAVVIWTVRRTHAIVGPVYRARKILRAAAHGEFPKKPVKFRRNDAFKELAADMNLCLETMQADRKRLNQIGINNESSTLK